MSLTLRRILLVILSIVGGVGGLLLVWLILNLVYNAGVTYQRYGPTYSFFTAAPIAIAIGVWLDYFLGTRLLGEGPKEQQ